MLAHITRCKEEAKQVTAPSANNHNDNSSCGGFDVGSETETAHLILNKEMPLTSSVNLTATATNIRSVMSLGESNNTDNNVEMADESNIHRITTTENNETNDLNVLNIIESNENYVVAVSLNETETMMNGESILDRIDGEDSQ